MAKYRKIMATRWGIASAGRISFDFVNALQLLPKADHEVLVVAARNLDRAKEFAKTFNIATAFGSYEELARCPDIDCVYIGSVNPQHNAMCELFLGAGKNVLCEKPMAMTNKQCRNILDLAKSKNVFYLEGFWSRFFPVYNDVRRELQAGTIGQVRMLQVSFGINILYKEHAAERFVKKELGGGSLLDVGCYVLMFAQFVFNGEKPLNISSSTCLNDEGVDESVVTVLTYSGNRMATLTCSLTCDLDQTATICGVNGIIKLKNFWSPVEVSIAGKSYSYPLPSATKPMFHQRSEGLMYEIEEVRRCLLKGLKESPKMTHRESLQISEISDEIRRQCGIVYAEDSQ